MGQFKMEIIDQCDSIEELNKQEEYWIFKLKSCVSFEQSNGYNLTLGGGNTYQLKIFTVEELIQFGEDYRKGILKNDLYEKYNKGGKLTRKLFCEIYIGEKYASLTKIEHNSIHSRTFCAEDVLNIVRLFKQTGDTKKIANLYKINPQTVLGIVQGKRHSKITHIENTDFFQKYTLHSRLISNSRAKEIMKLKISGKGEEQIAELLKIDYNLVEKIYNGKLLMNYTKTIN